MTNTTHVTRNLLQDAMLESTTNAFLFMFYYIYSFVALLAFTISKTKFANANLLKQPKISN